MKRLLLLAALFAATMSGARAYDFSAVAPTGQTLYYNIVSGGVQVTSQNTSFPYYNYSTYPTGALTIPDSVTRQGTTYAVVSIGDYAFRDCKDLRRVTIPASVKEFGVGIFEGCDKRQLTVTVEIGSAAEQYCKDIGVNIEYATMSGIGANGRITYRPLSRETVALVSYSVNTNALFTTGRPRPDTTLSLFSSVDYYTVVRLCEGALTDMGYYEQLILPDTLTEIEDRAIVNRPTLKEITIPAGVKKIGRHAFDAVGSDQLVFRVVRGSYAEKYCRDKGFSITYDP